MNILLLGANERAAFSFAKSFQKQGYSVTVINDKWHPINYSRFVKRFIKTNYSFEQETENSLKEIEVHLSQTKYDVLIPVHDVALTICKQFKDLLSLHTKILYVNPDETQIFCSDKYALWTECKTLQLPVPYSIIIKELKELESLPAIHFPCIAKPVSSVVYCNGKIFSYSVKKIYSMEELVDFVREKIETVAVMIQEILTEGFGAGYNFLSVNGQVINAYAHQRINEAHGGGQSSYRKTIPPGEYNIESYSKKLLAQINWTGIAMIEYRVMNNTPYIMEINGRGWGSMELGIFAGCNLPVDMIKALYLDQPVLPYQFRKPVFARNLLNEFLWVLKFKSVPAFFKWVASCKDIFEKDNIVEDSFFVDPSFRLMYAINIAKVAFIRLSKKIRDRLLSPSIHAISNKSILEDKHIAIVCKGNINRSAFAEKYIQQKIKKDYNITSYGTLFEENRLSPIDAINTARESGVDLQQHRSKYLDKLSIDKTDIFIIMDTTNYYDIRKLGVPKNKIFLLSKNKIHDPYKKDISFYRETFNAIAEHIQQIF